MLMRSHYLFLGASLLLSILLISCQRANGGGGQAAGAPPKAAAPARVLRFGAGGGFAGTITAYSLTSDGMLDRRSGRAGDTTAPATRLAAPPAGQVARCFQLLDAFPADSLTFRQPGNFYYFVEGETAAGRAVAVTWSGSGAAAPH